jgi:hypothetical protein
MEREVNKQPKFGFMTMESSNASSSSSSSSSSSNSSSSSSSSNAVFGLPPRHCLWNKGLKLGRHMKSK